MKKIRRVPTILGVCILLIGVGAGVFAVRQGSSWLLRAEPDTIPKEVKITNITEAGLVVSWITDKKTTGFVKYGPDDNLSFVANDDRNQGPQENGLYLTHYVTITNLEPEENYSFKIASDGKIFDNNGQPYRTSTGPEIKASPPPSDMVYGTVEKADGSPASGAVVYLSLANTTTQSALVKSSGDWVIPLNLARSKDQQSYASYDKKASIEDILVQGGAEGVSTVKATTSQDSPLPNITLGQNYDFRKPVAQEDDQVDQEINQEASPTLPPSKFSLDKESSPSAKDKLLTIINPSEDEEVGTNKPAFIGTAPAGEILSITVESPAPQTGRVTVDENGEWEWSPPEDLEPGEHTITATYTDDEGILKKISRTFIVLAAADDDFPAIESTPSATLTPTPTTTPSGRAALPSTESGVPDSGHPTPTFFLFITGTGLMVFSLLGYHLSKREIL